MFTGIVEEIGRVQSVSSGGLVIRVSRELADLRVSDSISVNGACLTVTSRDEDSFSVDVVPETLRRTNLGALRAGDPVDLERSLAVDGRFGGHVVQGHVDSTGAIESVAREGEALLLRFQAPPSIMRYVVEKGFIAVDGVSLTVVDCNDRSFSVTVIPFTRDNTILGSKAAGDAVNLEADIMAKYVERLLPGPQGR